jgi:hypothetical protein
MSTLAPNRLAASVDRGDRTVTDPQPPKATPTRKPAAKAATAKTAAAKTQAAKAPAAKAPAAKAPAVKAPVTKAPAAKTAAAAKAPVAKPAAAVKPAAAPRTAVAKTTAPAAPAAAFAPVEPAFVAPTPAAAPAGWYPVSAGSANLRYWDGAAWTEHIHNPAVAVAPVATARPVQPKAPEGTSPNTIWFWLTVASVVVGIAGSAVSAVSAVNLGSVDDSAVWTPAFTAALILGAIETVAYILFPILDWRVLRKRGVPSPFHWAWSLFSLPLSSPIVYVIGRTVVVKRRTGKGLAPLWVFVGLQVISWIFGLILIVAFFIALATQFGNTLGNAGDVL